MPEEWIDKNTVKKVTETEEIFNVEAMKQQIHDLRAEADRLEADLIVLLSIPGRPKV